MATSLARGSKLKSFLSLRSANKEDLSTEEEDKKESDNIDPESGIEFVPTVDMPSKRFCEVCNLE